MQIQDTIAEMRESISWQFSGLEQLEIVPRIQNEVRQSFEAKQEALDQLERKLQSCTECALHTGRSNLVFGHGNPNADLIFISSTPSEAEDAQAKCFVGEQQALLQKMSSAMGFGWEELYFMNIVKCHPPQDRLPQTSEVDLCEKNLIQQIEIIEPRAIIALGNLASQTLLRTEALISNLRGKWAEYKGVPVMPSWDLDSLIMNPNLKREAWSDLKQVMAVLGKAI